MDKHIVFFDAECPLCRTMKAVLKQLDWNNAILWHPVQEVRESVREQANCYKNMYDEIYMFTKDKQMLTGFNTIRKILVLLPPTLPLALLLYLPFAARIGNPAYRFVSKRRYQWFGRIPYNNQ
ncbi:hypothetical protein GCM10007063_18180 [Lentibacillus kapialis]|uniref:DUF393 domain-containing protein n=1 Tax=Lentibacillus kapialis TaxID=340214 RepID=A0A917PX16_9BACI|nr:DUF393 domain-containing protein [Lentibacillus kapialis]GGJ96100.1 hypothetical protein GCM10007063_18180 [Lentibacillus kapialis]